MCHLGQELSKASLQSVGYECIPATEMCLLWRAGRHECTYGFMDHDTQDTICRGPPEGALQLRMPAAGRSGGRHGL